MIVNGGEFRVPSGPRSAVVVIVMSPLVGVSSGSIVVARGIGRICCVILRCRVGTHILVLFVVGRKVTDVGLDTFCECSELNFFWFWR